MNYLFAKLNALKVFLPLVGLLLFVACEKEETLPETQTADPALEFRSNAKAGKVAICHYSEDGTWRELNISQNALQAHLDHGDYLPTTWYIDTDGDGYGDASNSTVDCSQPDGYANNPDDCDDNNAAVNPGATEIPYNGIDDDCNANTPDDDLDGDGFNLANDCNDNDPAINPDADEVCDDGIDNNCDGQVDEDCGPSVPTITSATGEIWMDRNLGASQVATSSTDASSYGDLYQWGRSADGHQLRTSSTISTQSSTDQPGHGDFIIQSDDWRSPQNDNLWQGVDGTNNPCPTGFRVPTAAEWRAERNSWTSNDAAGAFTALKLPLASARIGRDGRRFPGGRGGFYWSSTVNDEDSQAFLINSSQALILPGKRSNGHSIRCIKD